MALAQVYNLVATENFSVTLTLPNGTTQTINYTTGQVVDIVLWDGITPWSPPPNTQAVLAGE